MKRFILILVVFFLLLLGMGTYAEGNQFIPTDRDVYFMGMLSNEETLFLLGDMQLFTWHLGDEELNSWNDDIHLPSVASIQYDDANSWHESFDGVRFFLKDGRLCGCRIATDQNEEPCAVQLCDIIFNEQGAVEAANILQLDMPAELRRSDFFELYSICAKGNLLYLLGEDNNGMLLCVMDSDNPKEANIEMLDGWNYQLVPGFQDGILLINHDIESGMMIIENVSTDGTHIPLCSLPQNTTAIAVDPESEQIFGTLEGKVCPIDLTSGALEEAVSALPLEPLHAALLYDGRIYAAIMDNGLAVLETDGHLDANSTITIRSSLSGEWLNAAVLQFMIEYPNLTPTLIRSTPQDVAEDMLTHSSDTDIYILDTKDSAYEALQRRDYMLRLSTSSKLMENSERMYPGIKRKTSVDGVPVALPVYVSGVGLGISERLLNKLGLTIEDLPTTWAGFLDFMELELQPRLRFLEDKDKFTYDGMTANGFRQCLWNQLINDWVYMADALDTIPDYEDPQLVDLLERLEQMDFSDYGLEEDTTFEDSYSYSYDDESDYLIQFDISYCFKENGMTGIPLLLSFSNEMPAILPLDLYAAFVNPFSTCSDEAIAMLEILADYLPETTTYALYPDMTEPVQQEDADERIAYYEMKIEQANTALMAAEAIDKQDFELSLTQWQLELEEYKSNGIWLIPEDKIVWFREHDDCVMPKCSSWFEVDTTGEAYDLVEQYKSGHLPVRSFLAEVNRKAKMKAMEEN